MARRRNHKHRTSPTVDSSTETTTATAQAATSSSSSSAGNSATTTAGGGVTVMNFTYSDISSGLAMSDLSGQPWITPSNNHRTRRDLRPLARHYRSPVGPASKALRNTVLAAVVGYYVQKTLKPWVLPWGSAVHRPDAAAWAPVDHSNDGLRIRHGRTQKIFERIVTPTGAGSDHHERRKMKGPETVVVGKDGSLYVMTEDAILYKLIDIRQDDSGVDIGNNTSDEGNNPGHVRLTTELQLVKQLGMGRPLGGRFTPDGGTLYVADAALGLLRVRNPHDPKSVVELIASSAKDRNGVVTPITYANDLAIGPKTGTVYFTDSTEIRPDRIRVGPIDHRFVWDTMYAAKVDLVRGQPTGRLLAYHPSTHQVEVLEENLSFPNGLAVDIDESFLFLAETFGPSLLIYHLKGDQKGLLETVVPAQNMTGYPDGADCYWSKERKGSMCYAAIPSSIAPMHRIWSRLYGFWGILLRTLLMCLPRAIAPKPAQYGAVIEVNMTTREFRYIQDPTGSDMAMLTGVRVHDGRLYLGSLENDYLGVYQLG